MHAQRAFREEQVCDWTVEWGRVAGNERGEVDGWRPDFPGPGNASYFIFSCCRPTGRECSQSGAGFTRTLKPVQRVAQKGEAPHPRLALCLGERLRMGWRGQGLELRPDGGSRRTGTVVGYFRSIIHAQRVGWSHS